MFHNSEVSHCWLTNVSLFVFTVNAANVFCLKPLFSHPRLLTSQALSTNQWTFYLHIICACWLQLDRLAARYANVNAFANNSPQGIKLTMFYLFIPSLIPLTPLCIFAFPPLFGCFLASLSLSFFVLTSLQLLFSPSHSLGALVSVSPRLSISRSSHTLPALLCFPATPLYHHHHVQAAYLIVQL